MLKTPADFIPLMQAPELGAGPTFVVHRGQLLLREGTLGLPDAAALAALGPQPAERCHALGLWQGMYYQLLWLEQPLLPAAGYRYYGLRTLFGACDEGWLALAGRACQLAEWARTHRYCGACATPMVHTPGERCYACPACGMMAYPRISPAMMVLVRKDQQVLLALHANSPIQRYTALAGFVEAGESVEEAVHREVHEEVGLQVHNLRYFGSQSWPFPHSLMVAFTADYLGGEIRTDPAELSDARWFGPDDDWPEAPMTASIAAALLQAHRPRRP